jgi:predicted acyl esterase
MRAMSPVRLEIRTRGDQVHAVREEQTWPPRRVRWTPLYLAPGELRETSVSAAATSQFAVPQGSGTFTFQVPKDMELVGPMKLRLYVELVGAFDAHLFVAVSKIGRAGGRATRELRFEGSAGFGWDVVAKGWQRLAHRRVDESRGEPHRPYHPHDRAEPLRAGEIVPVDIEILPSATYFASGDALRLQIQGHWLWRRSMFFGMFPYSYAPSPEGKVILHLGNGRDSHLLVPRA